MFGFFHYSTTTKTFIRQFKVLNTKKQQQKTSSNLILNEIHEVRKRGICDSSWKYNCFTSTGMYFNKLFYSAAHITSASDLRIQNIQIRYHLNYLGTMPGGFPQYVHPIFFVSFFVVFKGSIESPTVRSAQSF